MNTKPKAFVYVDGFNFYFRRLKDSPYKWLNIRLLCENIFPELEIEWIKYFTAKLRSPSHDPGMPGRQEVYFKALRTLPKLSIELGHFRIDQVSLPQSGRNPVRWVTVEKMEEKGSDVNLATEILLDAFDNKFNTAIVITNDSDLARPLKTVKRRFQKTVVYLTPSNNHISRLKNATSYVKEITDTDLANSQFPETIQGPTGNITKPQSWY